MWTPSEQRAIREEIKTLLSLLWRTGEIFLHKPDVAAERRNIMHYLYDGLSRGAAGARSAAAPGLGRISASTGRCCARRSSLPRFSLSTWVGGDRDGHPLVTRGGDPQTLDDLRLHGLLLLQRQLAALARQTSLSDRLQPPPAALRDRVRQLADGSGERGQAVARAGAGGNMASAGRPDAGAPAARRRLSRRRTPVARAPDDTSEPAS